MNHPKIGYLVKRFPKLSETFILNEILELERQGVDLHIFSLRQPYDKKVHPSVEQVKANVSYIPSIVPQFNWQSASHFVQDHLKLFRQNPKQYFKVFKFHINRPESKRFNQFLQAGSLALELQKQGIKHLQVHFANVPTSVAEIASQFCGIPYSIFAHAKDIYLTEPDVLNRRIANAKFVLTCTQFNQNYLKSICTSETPIYLSYHGIDLARFEPNFQEKAFKNDVPFIFSVGRFCDKKGFPDLIKACSLLKQEGYNFKCKIVGYGELKTELEQQIKKSNLEETVSLLGQMSQDELIKLYHQADLFVLACRVTENGDRDGIPNVFLEAMAMNIPVISTNISGISELIESHQNGVLVPEKNPEAIANEIATLINQPQRLQQLRQKTREKVLQQFSLKTHVKEIRDLLLGESLENQFKNLHKIDDSVEVTV